MPWFKIDDGFTNSKPVLRLQRRVRTSAIGLWTLAGAWSAKELTDGFVPEYVIEELASTAAIAGHLVRCGLWEEAQEGWQFKGWEKYQPTREQILEARDREAERKRKYRESQRRPSGTTPGRTEGHQRESEHPDPTRPDPTRPSKEEAKASSDTAIRNDFTDWYIEYPRKASRGLAEKAYIKARKTATAEQLLEGVRRYAADPNREQEFTKLPATWLNAGSWEDDPLPARGAAFTAAKPDHSARARAKEADMLARLQAQQDQPFLEIES